MKTSALLLALLSCSCVSVPMAGRDLDARAREARPAAGAAKLYVYRPSTVIGTLVVIGVHVDGAWVGDLPVGTFVAVTLRPGEHEVVVRGTTGEAQRRVVIEEGGSAYVRASLVWGGGAAAEVVQDEGTALAALRKTKLVASPAAERIRELARELARVTVDPVEPEALVEEAARGLAAMGGAEPATAPDLDAALDRARAARPGVSEADLATAGVRMMLAALDPRRPGGEREAGSGLDSACGLLLRSSGGQAVVAAVLPDSPAAAAGIEAGMALREVDGRSVRDRSVAQLVDALAGPPGSEVALAIGREGAADRKVVLRRAPADASALDCRVVDGRVLYLRPWNVSSAAARRVRDHARAAGGASRMVVLDLRDASVGSVDGARELADSFVASGPLLAVYGARVPGVDAWYLAEAGTSPLEDARVAVLVNGGTVRAAEAVAAALQDGGRAKLLGTRTAGAGVVDWIHPVAGARLRVPTARLYRPNRAPIDGDGVTPDVVVDGAPEIEGARPRADGGDAEPLPAWTDVACPGVASPGAVSADPVVVRAVGLLLEAVDAR